MIDGGTALGPALKASGYRIRSGCAGYGYCADCMVTIVDRAENTDPPTYDERRILGALFRSAKYRDPQPTRLACQVKIRGPVAVDISLHLDAPEEQESRPGAALIIPASSLIRHRKL